MKKWAGNRGLRTAAATLGIYLCLLSPVPRSLLCADDSQDNNPQNDLNLVDPEFTNTPLPKLVLPPEPPPGIQLPEFIVKSDEWRGVQCGVQEARHVVFQHADKWQSFWQRAMAPYSARLAKVPPVDFDKYMVVGVFLGQRNRPNFEIEIRKIREENQPDGTKALVVRWREIRRMQGVFVPPFSIQPFHLKRVDRYDGPVIFTQVRR